MFNVIIAINADHRMTKSEAEAEEKAIFEQFDNVGMRLHKLRVEHGWEALGFKSFRDYAESLQDRMSLRKVYYLADQAEVNSTLSEATGKTVRLPMRHALALKDLAPEQRLLAFQTATGGNDSSKPNEKAFEKAAAKVRPRSSGGSRSKGKKEEPTSWTEAQLKEDQELSIAFGQLRGLYGQSDAKLIQNGTVGLKRTDVLYLAKLPKPKLMEIQDLIFANHWTPQDAVKFTNTMPDEYSTVEDLINFALATKGKFLTATMGGATVTCKINRAPRR